MLRTLTIVLIVITTLHGLIHLMGLVAYWPLGKIASLPYKTVLLGGRLEVGASGMRFFSLLWLLAALGFVAAAVLLALGRDLWAPLMLVAVLLSLALCILDWQAAFRGAWIDAAFLVALFVVFGFRVQPTPFPNYNGRTGPVKTVPIPDDLPTPVERLMHATYGDQVPVYTSAVISGRGTVRFMGITLPARLRFIHIPEQGYRHYIEATFYNIPLIKVNEQYLNGRSRFALPFGVVENEPTQDSAANQGLWAEMVAYPAIYATDARLQWEALDDNTAILHIPYDGEEQDLTMHFDPQSAAINRVETMRYRDAKSGKIRWWGDMSEAGGQNGQPAQQHWEITWEDEGTPWLIANIEDMLFNADVSTYIQQTSY
ncbi:MAG: hypothetical protein M1281_17035 [Chloroflexi bacterium]|nr:hypothetical protein [Chloroflexota bacterium]